LLAGLEGTVKGLGNGGPQRSRVLLMVLDNSICLFDGCFTGHFMNLSQTRLAGLLDAPDEHAASP
jgi:hypothetical protein